MNALVQKKINYYRFKFNMFIIYVTDIVHIKIRPTIRNLYVLYFTPLSNDAMCYLSVML